MTISETDVINFLSGSRKMKKVGQTKVGPTTHTIHIYQAEDPEKRFVYTARVDNCYLELNARASGEREGVDVGINFCGLESWRDLESGLRQQFRGKRLKNPYDVLLLEAYEAFLFPKQAL